MMSLQRFFGAATRALAVSMEPSLSEQELGLLSLVKHERIVMPKITDEESHFKALKTLTNIKKEWLDDRSH